MVTVKRLISAWKRHSSGSLLQLISRNILYYTKELLTGNLFIKNKKSVFDVTYSADTDEIREIGSLDIESNNARYGVRYQPSPHDLVTKVIQALPIDYSQFTFLDFGAGKGRVLLIAAQSPFAAVIGIEFSRELCKIASDNIRKISPEKKTAICVECHYSDVTHYRLPETPLVCYFYNPFDQPVMQIVLDKLAASLKERSREIYIIYIHPEYRSLLDSNDYWKIIDESNLHVVYRAQLSKFLE